MSKEIKPVGPYYAYREDRIKPKKYQGRNWGVKDSQGHLMFLGGTQEEAEAHADRLNKKEGFE